MKNEIAKPLRLAQAVMIQHTLFSLPFAVSAMLMETKGIIPTQKLVWIFLAIVGARNGANGLNRLIDHQIDAKNPRTKNRHLPSGKLQRLDLWIFVLGCFLLLVGSTFMLNPLCVVLLPVALIMIIAYSYTKRFTWLCHYFLGATVAIAPMGTLLALNGGFKFSYFVLSASVALWVAGFDIIYATQDIDFDRSEGLHSVPARFGVRGALFLASFSHFLSFLLLLYWGTFYQAGLWYYIGCMVVGLLLFVENGLVAPGKLKHVTTAAYHINEIVSVLFFLFIVLEVYLP
ncbi:4-hydroxybenzoate octaprenyltransferase [uncultured Sphaerochaeta sp.]|uniref:4-hydroxybenzoate octaprenyltransferase n=1 Tax=uncultured Sphaerochaeta sp. TaxID=886478 RepID=UPI002A0A5320|nr:4-hydroxybenzoate octaprenyltransferase [uncultured Sphaerochaeta sp.]